MASEAFLGGMCCGGSCDPATCVCGPDLCQRNVPPPVHVEQIPQELGDTPPEVVALARVEEAQAIITDMRRAHTRGRGWSGPMEPIHPSQWTHEEFKAVLPVIMPVEASMVEAQAAAAAEFDAALEVAVIQQSRENRAAEKSPDGAVH